MDSVNFPGNFISNLVIGLKFRI